MKKQKKISCVPYIIAAVLVIILCTVITYILILRQNNRENFSDNNVDSITQTLPETYDYADSKTQSVVDRNKDLPVITSETQSEVLTLDNGSNVKFNVKIPKLTSEKYNDNTGLFNEMIMVEADAVKNEYLRAKSQCEADVVQKNLSYTLDYEVYTLKDDIISVLLVISYDDGISDYPVINYKSANYSLVDNKFLSAADIAEIDSILLDQKLKEHILEDIKNDEDAFYLENPNIDEFYDSSRFLYKDHSIYIFFNPKEISSSAVQMPLFEYNIKELIR